MSSRRAPIGAFVGLCTLDVVQEVEHLPGSNEKITARRQAVAAGGPATNAAVTFAALGGHAVLVTALGTGAVADTARTDLVRHGVEIVDVAPQDPDRLSVSSVLVRAGTGERAVVSTDAGSRTVQDLPDFPAVAESRSGSVMPPRVEPIDTSGAGDAFHGAYCFFAANGTSDIARLLEGAARVASTRCAHFGPRSWLQELDESLSGWVGPPTA